MTDKTEVWRAGLGLAAFHSKLTRKFCQSTDTKPVEKVVGEAGR